jgi:hypothetical protein
MFSLSGNTQSFGSSRSPHTAETELSFDDQISLQINSEGGFSASLHPSELIRTLQSASTWTARATAAAILSNTSEALLKSLVELADSQTSSVASATAPSSALFSILKTWLAEALTISQTSTASPFGSNEATAEATAEAVSCILQTLIKIPVDLKRIAASKIGHLVMKLHTKGSESSSGLSIQISEIYKTATRIVTLWKESKASKSTTQDVAIVESTVKSSSSSSSSLSATTSSSVSKSTTKMSSSSSSSSSLSSMSNTQSTVPTSLPFMATLSSSSKTKSPSAMDVDDDIVETSKKRPRSITKSEDVKGGGVATTSSSNTTLSSTTTSKKTKTDGEFIKLQEKYRSSYLYPYITDTRLCA